jgi:hypothetical protein
MELHPSLAVKTQHISTKGGRTHGRATMRASFGRGTSWASGAHAAINFFSRSNVASS